MKDIKAYINYDATPSKDYKYQVDSYVSVMEII